MIRDELVTELNTAEWKRARVLIALLITSQKPDTFFASEADFCKGMQDLQNHIEAWMSYQDLNKDKADIDRPRVAETKKGKVYTDQSR